MLLHLPLNQKSLHAFSGIHLACIYVPLRGRCNHMQIVASTACVAEKSEMAQCLAIRMVYGLAESATDYTDFTDLKSVHGLVRIGPRG